MLMRQSSSAQLKKFMIDSDLTPDEAHAARRASEEQPKAV